MKSDQQIHVRFCQTMLSHPFLTDIPADWDQLLQIQFWTIRLECEPNDHDCYHRLFIHYETQLRTRSKPSILEVDQSSSTIELSNWNWSCFETVSDRRTRL